MARAIVIPPWLITDEWAIGLDPLNWKLYRRSKLDGDNYTHWKVEGYYPTLRYLIRGLQGNILMTESDAPSFREHLSDALAAAREAVTACETMMLGIGVGLDTLPPKYADYALLNTGESK